MDWDVFICQVDVYCAALYRASLSIGCKLNIDGQAARQAVQAVGSRCLSASLLTAQTDAGKGGRKKEQNSATHD